MREMLPSILTGVRSHVYSERKFLYGNFRSFFDKKYINGTILCRREFILVLSLYREDGQHQMSDKTDRATADHNKGQEDASNGKWDPPGGIISELGIGTTQSEDKRFHDYHEGFKHGQDQKK